MDTILDSPFIVVSQDYEIEAPIEKASVWIKENSTIRPSGTLTTLDKLNPGIYKVEITREEGLHCKKISTESDELFTFSNSIIKDLLDEINIFWDKKDLYKK